LFGTTSPLGKYHPVSPLIDEQQPDEVVVHSRAEPPVPISVLVTMLLLEYITAIPFMVN